MALEVFSKEEQIEIAEAIIPELEKMMGFVEHSLYGDLIPYDKPFLTYKEALEYLMSEHTRLREIEWMYKGLQK